MGIKFIVLEEGLGLLPRAIGFRVRVGKCQVLEALSKSAKPGAGVLSTLMRKGILHRARKLLELI